MGGTGANTTVDTPAESMGDKIKKHIPGMVHTLIYTLGHKPMRSGYAFFTCTVFTALSAESVTTAMTSC
jgi:hypothetical protein